MSPKFIVLAAGLCATFAAAQSAPYAGQQDRTIKALSEREVADLESGQGMGLAKAAELNGYPGPAHVLENADALALSARQRADTQALFTEHKALARQLGAQLLALERSLDRAFARRSVDASQVARLTREIGELQGRLREEHLRTHLAQTAMLDPGQVHKYSVLRGYVSGKDASPAQPASTHDRSHH